MKKVQQLIKNGALNIIKKEPEEGTPQFAIDCFEAVTDEMVVEAIRSFDEWLDISITAVGNDGHPTCTAGPGFTGKICSNGRYGRVLVAQTLSQTFSRNAEVWANVYIIGDNRISAKLFLSNPLPYLGENGGSCPFCYGNMCWECNFSGGV